jgi:glycosyltransferase involved in cell wall biosynthesis
MHVRAHIEQVRPRLRLLFVTGHVPYPARSGGTRRELELLERIASSVSVDVVALRKPGALGAESLRGHTWCRELRSYGTDEPDDAAGACALERRHSSELARAAVATYLDAGYHDLVHVEGFQLVHLLPPTCSTPLVVGAPNIEHQLWEQRSRVASNAIRRAAHAAEARRTKRRELAAWHRADLCVTVTEEDRRALRALAPHVDIAVVPDGADCATGTPRALRTSSNTAVFIANFGYDPNVDAAVHLCRHIWPRVVADDPDAQLELAGYSMPDDLRALARRTANVQVLGEVASVAPVLARADVVVCPLRVGGGVKVKVLEALAAGKAVVTTPIGAQGLGDIVAADGLVVRDSPTELAAAVAGLLRSPQRRRELERRGHGALASLPTWDEAAARLLACYEALATPGRRSRDVEDSVSA